MPFAETWMDLKIVIQSEVSQKKKNKYCIILLLCGIYDFTFTFHFHALEKEMATHSSVLAWRVPLDRGAWRAAVHGVTESDRTESWRRDLGQFMSLS